MNQCSIGYLKALKYPSLSFIDEEVFKKSISGPGDARIKFLYWIFNKLSGTTDLVMVINSNNFPAHYQNLLKFAINFGFCSEKDLNQIMGKNQSINEWRFIDKLVEAAAYVNLNPTDFCFIEYPKNFDINKEIENFCLKKEPTPLPLLPPDIEKLLHKYRLCNNMEILSCKLEDLNMKIESKEKYLSENYPEYTKYYSTISDLQIVDYNLPIKTIDLLSRFDNLASQFREVYGDKLTTSVNEMVDGENDLTEVVEAIVKGRKLDKLNEIVKNLCKMEGYCAKISAQENLNEVDNLWTQLNNEIYDDLFTGEKTSIKQLIRSTADALIRK